MTGTRGRRTCTQDRLMIIITFISNLLSFGEANSIGRILDPFIACTSHTPSKKKRGKKEYQTSLGRAVLNAEQSDPGSYPPQSDLRMIALSSRCGRSIRIAAYFK